MLLPLSIPAFLMGSNLGFEGENLSNELRKGAINIILQDANRKWPTQWIHNFADMELMPWILLRWLLIW